MGNQNALTCKHWQMHKQTHTGTHTTHHINTGSHLCENDILCRILLLTKYVLFVCITLLIKVVFFITLRLCMYHVAYKSIFFITLRRNLLPSLLLVWPTQLDPALGTLFVCVCMYVSVCPIIVRRNVVERRVT